MPILSSKFSATLHRVLAGQAIDHQQGFARVGHVAHGCGLRDQLFVDLQAAGGVEHVDVIAAKAGLRLGALGDGDRVLALDDGQGVDADLRAEDRQLLHRGGAVDVERGHQHALAVALLETLGQLGGGGGLARALQADHQDRRGRVVDLQRAGIAFAGQGVDQRVVHDLDDLLAGCDRFGHRLAGGLVLHRLDEIARHGQRDVGLQQGDAHLAQGGFDVVFAQRALFGQAVKDTREAFGQILKHARLLRPFRYAPQIRRTGPMPNAPVGETR